MRTGGECSVGGQDRRVGLAFATAVALLMALAAVFAIAILPNIASTWGGRIDAAPPAYASVFSDKVDKTLSAWSEKKETLRLTGKYAIADTRRLMSERPDADWGDAGDRLSALEAVISTTQSIRTIGAANRQIGGMYTDVLNITMVHEKEKGWGVCAETRRLMSERPGADWGDALSRLAELEAGISNAKSRSAIDGINHQISGLYQNVYNLNVTHALIDEQARAAEEARKNQSGDVNTNVDTNPDQGGAGASQEAPRDPILNGLDHWIHWNQNEPNWGDYTDQGWWNGCATVSEAMILATYSGNTGYTPDWMSNNGLSVGHSSPYSYHYSADGDIAIAGSPVSDYVNEHPETFHLKATWDASFNNAGNFDLIRNACAGGGCVHVRINPNEMPSYTDFYAPTGIHSVVIVKVEGDRVVIADPGSNDFIIATVGEVMNAFRINNPENGDVCYGHFWEIFEKVP